MTSNDTTGWDNGCPSGQNLVFSYFANPAALANPITQNCMSDFGGLAQTNYPTSWTDGYTWKTSGVISVKGVLYMAVTRFYDAPPWYEYGTSIMMSKNGGRSWCYDYVSDCDATSNGGAAPAGGHGEFCVNSSACTVGDSNACASAYYDSCLFRLANIFFVQYENDGDTTLTVDDQNNYIYAFATPSYGSGVVASYLLRIARSSLTGHPENMMNSAYWRYYTGGVGGSLSSSGNWTGYGTSGSNKPPQCAASPDPACGIVSVMQYYEITGSPIYVDSTFGYLMPTGFGERTFLTSQGVPNCASATLTGCTSAGSYWVPQIFAPDGLRPSGWPGASGSNPDPLSIDFSAPVLSTLGTCGGNPCLTVTGSGDYLNGSPEYSMYAAQLTLTATNQTNNYSCNPKTAFPYVAPSNPSVQARVGYMFDGDTYAAAGRGAPLADFTNNFGSTALPADLLYVRQGLGFPTTATTDVFQTPYSSTPEDFTLLIVYNRSTSMNTGNNYERIADKSYDGYGGDGGFAVNRNGTIPNDWCVILQATLNWCDSTHFPDGQPNLMGVRQQTSGGQSTLTVWNSDLSTQSKANWYLFKSAPATLPGSANSSYLYLGNSEAKNTPFTGTILAVIYYNTGLNDTDAQTATQAMNDSMYCSARRVILPGVTGNN